jgi:GntR family transcriptional repressor for pyruvate dehydrogenase complex
MELRQPMRRWMEQKASLPGGYDQVVVQHAAILESIEKRDPDRAESALRTHLESAGEHLTAALLGRKTAERRTDHGHK